MQNRGRFPPRQDTTVKELSIMINEDKTKVRKALKGLQGKVDKGKMKTFVEGLA